MATGKFVIKVNGVTAVGELDHLEMAELMAARFGFYNLDLEDSDSKAGNCKLVAYSKDRTITAACKTIEATVDRFLAILCEQGFQASEASEASGLARLPESSEDTMESK